VQALSNEELLAVLRHARAKSERDWLMILVGYWHGLRASEVVGLTPDNFHDGKITVQRLKGSRKTTHPLREHADPLLNERQALFDLVAKLLPNQKLFPIGRVQFFRLFRKHATAAGVEKHKRHPHVLKHTIGSQLAEKIPLNKVQRYLGHESLGSTGIYTEVTDEQASAAVDAATRAL
jgi:integrase